MRFLLTERDGGDGGEGGDGGDGGDGGGDGDQKRQNKPTVFFKSQLKVFKQCSYLIFL